MKEACLIIAGYYTRMTSPVADSFSASLDLHALLAQIRAWGRELGFQQLSIADVDLSTHEPHLHRWLDQHFHGTMDWMAENSAMRCHPEQLHTGTLRVITIRMDYRPQQIPLLPEQHDDKQYTNNAQISCYAWGRDYHKVIRARLSQLAECINAHLSNELKLAAQDSRPFVDSAPVLERALAEKSGLGWIGKNTMLINKNAGSWFFLGELFTNLPLPLDKKPLDKRLSENNSLAADSSHDYSSQNYSSQNHCGTCSACIDVCPTGAIIAPYQVDARKCISYLTIEHKGSIPVELRSKMGNRVFGCDDCQIVCPWNKFSETTTEKDFSPRAFTQNRPLHELFLWSEEEFLKQTEGSPVRRVGYERWLRNLAVGLGNAQPTPENIHALQQRRDFPSALVQEHVGWAIKRLSEHA
jgi:epoxyqueuosine reductase